MPRQAWNEEHCEALIEHMAAGYSYTSFAGVLGVTFPTFKNWEASKPEWLQSREIGELKRRMFWEKTIMESAQGKSKGNAASIIFSLKNYYPDDYKDRREIEVQSASTIIIDTGIHREALERKVVKEVEDAIVSDILQEDDALLEQNGDELDFI